jgi:hypothetical protein
MHKSSAHKRSNLISLTLPYLTYSPLVPFGIKHQNLRINTGGVDVYESGSEVRFWLIRVVNYAEQARTDKQFAHRLSWE